MKKNTIKFFCIGTLIAVGLCMQSFYTNDSIMKKENGVYIINTTELCKNVEGYNGPTPLKVYINKNKVERIEFLKTQETPKYYAKVKKVLMDKWNNLKVNDAKKLQVDAVTGATYSSEAVIKNVQLGLDYYQQHK